MRKGGRAQATRPIEAYLCEYAMKMVTDFGRAHAGAMIKSNLGFWRKTYGDAVADTARKLIAIEWIKRFPAPQASRCAA